MRAHITIQQKEKQMTIFLFIFFGPIRYHRINYEEQERDIEKIRYQNIDDSIGCILHNLYTTERFKRLFRRNRDFQLKPAVLRDTHKLADEKVIKV